MRFKRGFLFTVLALVMLSFMLILVQAWAQTKDLQEKRASERFRVEALKTSIALIDEGSFSKFSKTSMAFAVHKLATSIAHADTDSGGCTGFLPYSTGRGAFPDGTAFVNESIFQLMKNGSVEGKIKDAIGCNGPKIYADDEMDYTLEGYFKKTSLAAESVGYKIVWGKMKNFVFNQTGPWVVEVSFEVDVNLTDMQGRTNIQKTLKVHSTQDINGLLDPFISRMDWEHRKNTIQGNVDAVAHKQVFHIKKYDDRESAKAKVVKKGEVDAVEGIGWFFGPTTSTKYENVPDEGAILNKSSTNKFIYVTSSNKNAVEQSAYYGAIMITGASGTNWLKAGIKNVGGCRYQVEKQRKCLYCLEKYTLMPKEPPNCPDLGIQKATGKDYYQPQRDIPYIVVKSWSRNDVKNKYSHASNRAVGPEILIANKYDDTTSALEGSAGPAGKLATKEGDSQVYDMNGPRDIAVCGFYVKSKIGPSYLQRFVNPSLSGGWSSKGTPYSKAGNGIESMVVGKWAGGAFDENSGFGNPLDTSGCTNPSACPTEFFSRVDYHFYSKYYKGMGTQKCLGKFIKGMPGCKNAQMCSSDGPVKLAIGRLALSNTPQEDYGTMAINYSVTGQEGFGGVCE